MISVIIPLYNKVNTVERAVRSVLDQTVSEFELIVVNNGSTDGSEDVVKRIDDPRIILISQPNQGVSMARNKGVAIAKGDYVAFLDADDEWRPTFLETVLRMREKYPDCAVFATAYQRCNARGVLTDIRLQQVPVSETFILDNYFEVAATSDPPFCSISVMVKKAALQAIGGFPKGIHQGEDLLTWARLAANYTVAYCRIPQSIFYTGEDSTMDKPKRVPSEADEVGSALECLYKERPNLIGLRQYLSHWHKMRASIYLRLPNASRNCRKEIREAQRWHKNRKLIIYKILLFLPYTLRIKLLRKL